MPDIDVSSDVDEFISGGGRSTWSLADRNAAREGCIAALLSGAVHGGAGGLIGGCELVIELA